MSLKLIPITLTRASRPRPTPMPSVRCLPSIPAIKTTRMSSRLPSAMAPAAVFQPIVDSRIETTPKPNTGVTLGLRLPTRHMRQFCQMPQTPLEKTEQLDQLRLPHGVPIRAGPIRSLSTRCRIRRNSRGVCRAAVLEIPTMLTLIGLDEAGFGPLLGPLYRGRFAGAT